MRFFALTLGLVGIRGPQLLIFTRLLSITIRIITINTLHLTICSFRRLLRFLVMIFTFGIAGPSFWVLSFNIVDTLSRTGQILVTTNYFILSIFLVSVQPRVLWTIWLRSF